MTFDGLDEMKGRMAEVSVSNDGVSEPGQGVGTRADSRVRVGRGRGARGLVDDGHRRTRTDRPVTGHSIRPHDDPAAQTLARCVEAVEGASPMFRLCPGVLDTQWYSQ